MKRQCYQGKFENDLLDAYYDTLEQALDVCKNQSRCDGVYDKGCDHEGLYHLCPTGTIHDTVQNSCSYQKYGK